jgi:hypothetical protein
VFLGIWVILGLFYDISLMVKMSGKDVCYFRGLLVLTNLVILGVLGQFGHFEIL